MPVPVLAKELHEILKSLFWIWFVFVLQTAILDYQIGNLKDRIEILEAIALTLPTTD